MNHEDEREIVDHLKVWWRRWGNYLIGILIAVLSVVVGCKGWHDWQRRQTVQAEKLYEQFQQAVHLEQSNPLNTPDDKVRIMRMAQDMENRFGRTPYAPMTALAAAKTLYQMTDITGAKAQLQWVIDHAAEVEYQQIARLRLAGVLLDEKADKAALKLISTLPTDAFKGLYANCRGDLLAAQNKPKDAKRAYQNAIQSLNDNDSSMRQMIQAKLETISKQ